MEGIPVKISEKYKPPRKFVLPGCVLNRINANIEVEAQYNFNLERSVLEQLTILKELKENQSTKRQQKCDDWLTEIKSKESTKENEESTTYPTMYEDGGSQMASAESTMLTPVPISINSRAETIQQEGQINLSDFENDTSSPFDNVELKTINEMEELANVLGGTSLKMSGNMSQHAVDMKNPLNNHVHLPNGYTSHHWNNYSYPAIYGSRGGGGHHQQQHPHTHHHIVSNPTHSYIHSTNDNLYTTPSSASYAEPQHSYNMSQPSNSLQQHQQIYSSYQTASLNKSHMIASQLTSYPTPTTSTASYAVSSPNNTLQTSSLHNPTTLHPTTSYVTTAATGSGVNNPVNIHLPSTSTSPKMVQQDPSLLQSPPSSPYITTTSPQNNIEQDKNNDGDNDNISKVLDNLKKDLLLRKYELENRGRQTQVISCNTSINNKQQPQQHIDPVQDNIGNNPFNQLNAQCQEFARNLAEMGFPLNRVARATEKFGADDAKVIEFLLQVQSLEEKNFPIEQIEKALVLFNCNEEDAISYLEKLNQIMKLGFKEEDVEDALSKSSYNLDKAVDILTS